MPGASFVVNQTFRYIFQWNFSWNSNIFIQENIFKHTCIVCRKSSTLFMTPFVNLKFTAWLKEDLVVDLMGLACHWANIGLSSCQCKSGPLFTKPTDVLPQDFVKSRSCEIQVYTFPIVLKFDGHLSSSAAEMPVKFRVIWSLLHSILRLRNFMRFGSKKSYCLVNRGPDVIIPSSPHPASEHCTWAARVHCTSDAAVDLWKSISRMIRLRS